MFDYDDLEDVDPVPDQQEEELREAKAAAAQLSSEAFTERREGCRVLQQLGAAAAPYLQQLVQVSESDEDYEVRKAAKSALRGLKAHGLKPQAPA
ncbi:unnamed protein product [Effrenium voratum]|uniref:HEAT repeat domain-containing protein n=1 Tax=Effrenium voratum TaxID=2562239 RepID=A0AA36HK33_9DINO|nr:unnamed protein product [Effrenium voratum]